MTMVKSEIAKLEISVPVQIIELVKTDSDDDDFRNGAMLLLPFIKNEEISYGKAAEMLGVNRLDLIDYYGSMGITYIDYDINELERDVQNAKRFHKEVRR